MGKRNKKKKKLDVSEGDAVTNNPFASALSGMTAPEADLGPLVDDEEADEPPVIPKIRTRIERKGRGGKTVTLVTGLESVDAADREHLASKLARALGAGVSADDDGTLVVQGDQQDRVEAWFAAERGP